MLDVLLAALLYLGTLGLNNGNEPSWMYLTSGPGELPQTVQCTQSAARTQN